MMRDQIGYQTKKFAAVKNYNFFVVLKFKLKINKKKIF